MEDGNFSLAICSMRVRAWPELYPGAALPDMDADGYMLYRMIIWGPRTSFVVRRVSRVIIFPSLLRTSN